MSAKLSSYEQLLLNYTTNEERPFSEWLEFDSTFPKPGKQGLVGLLKCKDKDIDGKYIYKISQYINYLIHHETNVMRSLNNISPFCPHFCKGIGMIECLVDPKCRKEGNPFNTDNSIKLKKEVMLCENITNSTKFYNYIRAIDKVSEDILYSSIKQTLLAISMAQKFERFTHYDLHSNNIMMKKCNKDVVFLYVLDEENQFAVPTFGNFPVIIDFGFAYAKSLDDGPLWPSMGHTDVGFTSNQFDPFADPKLFLITVAGEIKEKRGTKKAKRLKRIVKNMFAPLNIDWINGWDKGKKSAAHYVIDLIRKYNQKSNLFKKYDHHCIDLIQSLIYLPLEKQDYSNIHVSYTAFINEWVKIENQISSSYYNLYILKCIVNAARKMGAAYRTRETCQSAIIDFQREIGEKINSVVKFCRTKTVNFEIMLCSLLLFARNIEGVLYDIISTINIKKERSYSKLPLKSVEQMYAAITVNLKDNYNYNDKTKVIVLDSIKKNTNILELNSNSCVIINKLSHLARGTYLYDLYKS